MRRFTRLSKGFLLLAVLSASAFVSSGGGRRFPELRQGVREDG